MTDPAHARNPIGLGSNELDDDMVAIYTDGLSALGAPELFATGHREEIAALASSFATMVQGLFPQGAGSVPLSGTLTAYGTVPVYFGDASDRAVEIAPDLIAKAVRDGRTLALTQLVVADGQGRLPWDADADQGQTVFCAPPPAVASSASIN